MTALDVLNKIRLAGGSIIASDGDLRVEAPSGVLTDRDRLILAKSKADLVRLLAPTDPEREAIQWVEGLDQETGDRVLAEARRQWSELGR